MPVVCEGSPVETRGMARDSDSEQGLSSDEEWLESWTPATLSRVRLVATTSLTRESHTERTASQNGKAGGNEQSDVGLFPRTC